MNNYLDLPIPQIPHNSINSKNEDWHAEQHRLLLASFVELIQDYRRITHKQVDRVTVTELLEWSVNQTYNPEYEWSYNNEG